MAQNVTINGANYSDVPAIEVPLTSGGGSKAKFMDTSDANATASDILSGKIAYVNGVKVTGTGSGGGGGGEITQYITFTAAAANAKVSIEQKGISYGTWTFKYSTDNVNWNDYTVGTVITIPAIGDYVSFAGVGNYATLQNLYNYKYFSVSAGYVNVSGILAGFYGQESDYAGEYAYCYMFYNQTRIYDISNLTMPSCPMHADTLYGLFRGCTQIVTPCVLPATELGSNAYAYMFYGCTKLASCPELPATTLAPYCYAYMFYGCTKLASCPELPATTLENYCYQYMFRGCTALTATMSSLPAMTMAVSAYTYMFYGCKALKTHCSLPATTLANSCYYYMFYDCDALETIAALPANTLVNSCYRNMYSNSAGIKVSATQTGEYQNAWRIPTSGTGTTASNWNASMLSSTGGTFTGNPDLDTTYYTANIVV